MLIIFQENVFLTKIVEYEVKKLSSLTLRVLEAMLIKKVISRYL